MPEGVTSRVFDNPALRTASFMARWRMAAWIWLRPCSPDFVFFHRLSCGKTHCQRQSVGAFGYLRSRAVGIWTRLQPSARSFSVHPDSRRLVSSTCRVEGEDGCLC